MKNISERASEYYKFLWEISMGVINEYFFRKYPEICEYLNPRGAATCLTVSTHYAVLVQRDELFGTEGAFAEYADDASEIDLYVKSVVNDAAVSTGLPCDLYEKIVAETKSSINPSAMWLLADMGGGGKKGRVIAIHSQIGNSVCRTFFRKRGASVAEMGEAGNVLNLLFSACYTKYAETLGFNEADYDEKPCSSNKADTSRERTVIDSISCPEHPFVTSLVEHITSDELKSYGHEAPDIGVALDYTMDYFNGYFEKMHAPVRQLNEGDVREFCESIDENVRRYAPDVSKKYLENRVDYVYEYGLAKGDMIIGILKEILGDDKFDVLENEILKLTNEFIDEFLRNSDVDDDDYYD